METTMRARSRWAWYFYDVGTPAYAAVVPTDERRGLQLTLRCGVCYTRYR
ncbi:MAG: hypothetical protein U9R48_11410 [Chloroflexota bacterium]|nr:hypothetical protein [Chloroflexota bacterium]